MTSDGGETWKKVLYIDRRSWLRGYGYRRQQSERPLRHDVEVLTAGPGRFISGSEKTGVFRSLDGGRTWTQLTNGLPKNLGRIGVRVAASNSNVVYVVGESNDGTLFRSDDRGDHFRMMTKDPAVVGRGLYYSHVTIDPTDENRIYSIGMQIMTTIDAGRTWRRIANTIHGDYHTVWVDPKDPNRVWIGEDGGIAVSYDRGETGSPFSTFPSGSFIRSTPTIAGRFTTSPAAFRTTDRGAGPAARTARASSTATGSNISGGDGFHVINSPDDPELFLSENQGGGIVRTDMRTHEQQDVSPQPKRNDGGPVSELKYRFNWNAPIVGSPHDKNTVYFGSNVVFKSTDFGKTWKVISPDLTTNDPEKQKSVGTVWTENTTAEYHCTVIRIAESPVQAGVIWAGTDDGNLQVTRDGGKHWTNVTGKRAGRAEIR